MQASHPGAGRVPRSAVNHADGRRSGAGLLIHACCRIPSPVVSVAEYRAEYRAEGEPSAAAPILVAVKRLKQEVLEAEEDVIRFIEEARLLRQLRHECARG